MRAALCNGTAVALILCVGSLPASAEMSVYYHVGSWDAFSGPGGDGRPVCGIGSTNPTDGRSLSLRFQIGGENVMFQAKKSTWNIPNGTEISVVLQVGLDAPWTLPAIGDGQIVEWAFDSNTVQTFDAQFRRGNSMTLTFPSGNEQPWSVGLNGSTAISNTFGRCITDYTQRAAAQSATTSQGATQPVGQAPAQPASVPAPAHPGPSQPYAPSGTQTTPR
jgi:hypothetical protein